MPDIDGGHYYLTALAPVHRTAVMRADKSVTAPSHALREALASLPNVAQSGAGILTGRPSPFARCRRTHFARFVVIDQPAYNGRDGVNALIGRIRKTDLLVAQPIDTMTRPWLLLAADFDATDEADGGLGSYLAGLWDVMAPELRAVYGHCYGFDKVASGADFAVYIRRCRIETTMSFNDYWTTPPPFPSLPFALVGAIVGGIAIGTWLLGLAAAHLLGLSGWWSVLALFGGVALGLWGAFRFVGGRGARAFPTAPHTDLKSILKALRLQRDFTRFAIDRQGAPPAALHAAFGDFVAASLPAELDAATQAPGVIGV